MATNAPGHMATNAPGHMATNAPGHMATSTAHHTATWPPMQGRRQEASTPVLTGSQAPQAQQYVSLFLLS